MTRRDPVWDDLERSPPRAVTVGGVTLARGSPVRLAPAADRRDPFDRLLAGRIGRVEGIDEDHEGRLHLAIVLADDPGRDLGGGRFPAHRFFFRPDEVEPLEEEAAGASGRRVLVAGIGNLFLGDDGFGVAVARRLAEHPLPAGVEVVDFGIRGMDLVYALGAGWDGVILIDAMGLGEEPGTVRTVEPDLPPEAESTLDGHAMDPLTVLRSARRLGPLPPHAVVVGCQPARVPDVEAGEDMTMELSPPVAAAVDAAVERVVALAAAFVANGSFAAPPSAGVAA